MPDIAVPDGILSQVGITPTNWPIQQDIAQSRHDTSALQPASGKAQKEKAQRACAACKLRRVRCERQPGQKDCLKCQTLRISCQNSTPKTRTFNQGSRIAEAKRLYGKDETQSTSQQDYQEASIWAPSPSYTSAMTILSDNESASVLVKDLIYQLAQLKISTFPLFRNIDIIKDFEAAGSHLSRLSRIDQALYITFAALAARTSNAGYLVGEGAPTLLEVGNNAELRQGYTLSQYGARRDHLAIYRDPLAFTREASKEARPFSAAAASHLRILAEDIDLEASGEHALNGWYSTVWTIVLRDALIASVTGRALDISSNDIVIMLRFSETDPVRIPSASAIANDWPHHKSDTSQLQLEGPLFMQLWAGVLQLTRRFVVEVSQPLAIAQPRLKLDFFDKFWSDLAKFRDTCAEAVRLARSKHVEPPDQVRVLAYSIDFLNAQAYRIIDFRCQETQLRKADSSGVWDSSLNDYVAALHRLRAKAEEEAFQAARRVILVIQTIFQPTHSTACQFFVPGYLVYEGLLVWQSLLLETKVAEDGGRADYSIYLKLSDLSILREAIAVTSWSSGSVLPYLQSLDYQIEELRIQASRITSLATENFLEYLAFEESMPSEDSPDYPLPPLPQPEYTGGPGNPVNYNLFSMDELNYSSSATEWLDAFLAQL